MRQTSLIAYNSLNQVMIGKRQREVLDALREIAPAPNRLISDHSGIPINVVTPRIGELAKKGLVTEAFTAVDIYGHRTIHWKPAKIDQREYDSGD